MTHEELIKCFYVLTNDMSVKEAVSILENGCIEEDDEFRKEFLVDDFTDEFIDLRIKLSNLIKIFTMEEDTEDCEEMLSAYRFNELLDKIISKMKLVSIAVDETNTD